MDMTAMQAPPRAPVSDSDAAALEQYLLKLWSEVLSRDGIGRDDNFFDLGGRSLHVIMMINRLQEAIGVDIPLTMMFEAQTVAEVVVALTSHEDEFQL
jgi:acyl carrier protein